MALVSIVIPIFNAAPYLRAAVDSALQQTYPTTEVILVDDGSADESLIIARQFKAPNVKVFTQPNRGASAARNLGLANARGDFVQFLDADDVLAPNKIEVQVAALAQKPSQIASGRWGVFTDQISNAKFTSEITYESASSIDWLINTWTRGGMMQPGAWLAPRSVLERAGPWNEELSLDDDGEYFGRVVLASSGVCFVPNAVIFYRSHGGLRVSAIRGERAFLSSLRSCELKEAALLAREDSRRTRRACASNYCRYSWENFPEGKNYVDRAIARWKTLDASVKPPLGGRKEAWLARCLGWKAARRLQKVFRSTSSSVRR